MAEDSGEANESTWCESHAVAPPIEDSVKLDTPFEDVLERYYTSLYLVNYRGACHDYRVLLHNNGLVVLLLAQSHFILQQQCTIEDVQFQVTSHTNRLDNHISGKHKHGAQRVTPEAPLIRLTLGPASPQDSDPPDLGSSGRQLTVPACVGGRLIQLNPQLLCPAGSGRRRCFQLLIEGAGDGRGFLAIIHPSRSALQQLRSRALSHSQYKTAIASRHTQPSGHDDNDDGSTR